MANVKRKILVEEIESGWLLSIDNTPAVWYDFGVPIDLLDRIKDELNIQDVAVIVEKND